MASSISCFSSLLLTVSLYNGFMCSAEDIVTYTEAGVLVEQRAAIGPHRRMKREISPDMKGFSHEKNIAMLQRHNDLRSTRPASGMMYMEWDDRLAETAQKWAENCDFRHSSNRENLADYNYVGENLYAGTHSFDPAHVVQLWYDEVEYYNYETRACKPPYQCGHYTQVVWDTSRTVGCGAKYCPVLKSAKNFNAGYHVVCHYGPGGNYVGQRPYISGESCSKCPLTAPFCVKGLCAMYPKIGAGAGKNSGSNLFLIATTLVTATVSRLTSPG